MRSFRIEKRKSKTDEEKEKEKPPQKCELQTAVTADFRSLLCEAFFSLESSPEIVWKTEKVFLLKDGRTSKVARNLDTAAAKKVQEKAANIFMCA